MRVNESVLLPKDRHAIFCKQTLVPTQPLAYLLSSTLAFVSAAGLFKYQLFGGGIERENKTRKWTKWTKKEIKRATSDDSLNEKF